MMPKQGGRLSQNVLNFLKPCAIRIQMSVGALLARLITCLSMIKRLNS